MSANWKHVSSFQITFDIEKFDSDRFEKYALDVAFMNNNNNNNILEAPCPLRNIYLNQGKIHGDTHTE